MQNNNLNNFQNIIVISDDENDVINRSFNNDDETEPYDAYESEDTNEAAEYVLQIKIALTKHNFDAGDLEGHFMDHQDDREWFEFADSIAEAFMNTIDDAKLLVNNGDRMQLRENFDSITRLYKRAVDENRSRSGYSHGRYLMMLSILIYYTYILNNIDVIDFSSSMFKWC